MNGDQDVQDFPLFPDFDKQITASENASRMLSTCPVDQLDSSQLIWDRILSMRQSFPASIDARTASSVQQGKMLLLWTRETRKLATLKSARAFAESDRDELPGKVDKSLFSDQNKG